MSPNEPQNTNQEDAPVQQPVTTNDTTPATSVPVSQTGDGIFMTQTQPVLPVKKSKKKLIIGAIIGGVILLALTAAGLVFALVYNNPETAVMDAFSKALAAKSSQVNGNASLTMQDTTVKLELSGATNENGQSAADITMTTNSSGDNQTIKSHIVSTKDELYVKVDDVRSIVSSYLGSLYTEDIETYYDNILDMVDGKWVVIKQSDIEALSGSSVNTEESQCVENEITKLQTDKALRDELVQAYRDNPLFTIESKGIDSDGYRYRLTPVSKDEAKAFLDAVLETKVFTAVDDCVSQDLKDQLSSSSSSSDNTSDTTVSTLDVWVDGWSHYLNKVSLTAKDDSNELTSQFWTKFNNNPSVTIPEADTTVDDLQTEFEKLQLQLMETYQSSSSLYDYTY